jgi:hypothetical protein
MRIFSLPSKLEMGVEPAAPSWRTLRRLGSATAAPLKRCNDPRGPMVPISSGDVITRIYGDRELISLEMPEFAFHFDLWWEANA